MAKSPAIDIKIHVPVLMYHSVSDNQQWLWGNLSCPVGVFEDHVRALVNHNFTTISLQHLYDHLAHDAPLPPNPIVLTFDDGYLDNWVYAYPILKRYGCEGTIFINPDFVDPRDTRRLNSDDAAAGRGAARDLETTGFLSWTELAEMESAGVMDVQSHTITHTWYFNDHHIVDFHHPQDGYPWLAWNAKPERKYLWLNEDQSSFVPFGTPIYTYRKSLLARRYFPDPKLADFLIRQVEARGGPALFQERGWRPRLFQWVRHYRSRHQLEESWESEEAYQARVRYELGASKEIIEARLQKKVNFVCWPGGGYNDLTVRIAKEVGYLSMVHAPGGKQPKQDARHTPRLPVPTLARGKTRTPYRSGRYLVYRLRCHQGASVYCLGCKVLSGYKLPLFWIEEAIQSADGGDAGWLIKPPLAKQPNRGRKEGWG
ncbi:MAG: polysaccharide deacetylase family protein [Anaerolineales bacterium]